MSPCWNSCGSRTSTNCGMASSSAVDNARIGRRGMGHATLRYAAGPRATSYGSMGRRTSPRGYQSVFSSDVTATVTSRRTPSTSCAYHSGKVSLSPSVMRMPYGSTELSRSCAHSRVAVSPARDACRQLPTSGSTPSSNTGALVTHRRASPTGTRSAMARQRPAIPSAAQTLHAEKLHK